MTWLLRRPTAGMLRTLPRAVATRARALAAPPGQPRSSRLFTDLFDLAPAGIGLLDESDRVLDANEALCRLLGHRRHEMLGMTAADLLHPQERSPWITGSDASPEQPRMLIRSDGQPLHCEVRSTPSLRDDGHRCRLVVFQDITERLRRADALHHQATHDELTGLANRQGLHEFLDELLDDDARHFAVLFCDIDNFKRVNDALGHQAGDELLIGAARRLQAELPQECTVARFSGDEFVILCPETDTDGDLDALATHVAECLRTVVPVQGHLVRISASVGVAARDGTATTGEDLVRFADAAMFQAKNRGPGRVARANSSLATSVDGQLHLEEQLHEALTHDRLALHYQPVVTGEGSVVMAEALVRWPHPDRGLLSPDVILPVAEQGNLLRELDLWVLRTALTEAAHWPSTNGDPVRIAVNLAALLPDGAEVVDDISTILTESGIDPYRVVLEMTETALVDLPVRTRQAMVELAGRGVRFAIDDFGTGYSSLARLKDLPAQILKLDRSFLPDSDGDSTNHAITRAVVELGHAMGHRCIAEGVETADQFRSLDGLDIEAYQGWLFSQPLPAPEFRHLLESGRPPRAADL